jgi:hypothetical protein
METSPDLEFEHYLAQKLSMTVARLRDEMSAEEFMRWSVYYGRLAQRQELTSAKRR